MHSEQDELDSIFHHVGGSNGILQANASLIKALVQRRHAIDVYSHWNNKDVCVIFRM